MRLWVLFFGGLALGAAQREIPLWSNLPEPTSKEIWTERGKNGVIDRAVTNVRQPTITVYLPSKDKANGAAVVICPGGGFEHLAIDKEGYDVARWLNTLGVAGFVLKYRLPKIKDAGYTVDTALQDLQRAIRIVRNHAREWNIDVARVGVAGFSAGGTLTEFAGTRFETGAESTRPDFLIMGYTGGVSAEELKVTANTPPAFMVHADDDKVSAERSVAFYLALKKAGVPVEMHIYAKGGHGFGVIDNHLPVSAWPQRCADWMMDRGLLRKP